MKEFIIHYAHIILLFPLLGFIINGLVGKFLQDAFGKSICGIIASLMVCASFALSLGIFCTLSELDPRSRLFTITLFDWINVGNLHTSISFLFDPLTSVMLLIISGVGFLIHIYAIGYMHHDSSTWRFFAFFNLFIFMMLELVIADNVFLMFLGWEGVGLCSYLLIGFWYKDKANVIAGNKAFIVNRIGDLGFIIGVFLLFWAIGSQGIWTLNFAELKEYSYLLENLYLGNINVVTIICLCFFFGACGKSAQIPLYVWLPDAMAGPTPVSALIHAATMVTAGIYMVTRLSFLFILSPVALGVIAITGAVTAVFAATIGFAQNDIKKILAYSTVSQLGYMFLALGVGAFSAGIFHVMTHAFFKALLFMGAGSIILGMHHEQDITKMGGLRKKMRWTYYTFLVATIALLGIFPLSGFFSKDQILWSVFSSPYGSKSLWLLGVFGAGLTSFYMIRLVTLTFFGRHHHTDKAHDTLHEVHESPKVIIIPLVILAMLSVIGGFVGVPHIFGGSNILQVYLSPVIADAELNHYPMITEVGLMLVVFMCVLGFAYGAYYLYSRKPSRRAKLIERFSFPYKVISRKYFVDEIYQHLFVNNIMRTMRFMARFDMVVVDGLVNFAAFLTRIGAYGNSWIDKVFVDGLVNGIATVIGSLGSRLRKIQTGYIQDYVYVLFASIIFILLFRFMIA